jgi:hypothetical protein
VRLIVERGSLVFGFFRVGLLPALGALTRSLGSGYVVGVVVILLHFDSRK